MHLEESFSHPQLCAMAMRGASIVRKCGGLYPPLIGAQERDNRKYGGQLESAHGNKDLFPAQYRAAVETLSDGVRSVYDKGVGVTHRVRGFPYSISSPVHTLLIASKFRNDIYAQRLFVCSAKVVSPETPIGSTTAATVEKKILTARSVLIDLR